MLARKARRIEGVGDPPELTPLARAKDAFLQLGDDDRAAFDRWRAALRRQR